MFDWLFKPAQNVVNGCSRQVQVTSSRHGTKIYTVYGDLPVDSIDALRIVSNNLRTPEPGETIELKTSLM
ncbi:hypothetical protein [Microcoleus sp. herbarium14]|uniref:hypothetical protein n=1 Tax=Microcoleus sp. herbarium14 TaxID=3055439 RepID=UPI002FD2AA31